MQQTDKHGPIRDDALKHDTDGLERSGHLTRIEEWVDPDTSGEAEPTGPMIGGTPPGMTPLEVEERSLLARHLGSSVYPASRDDLVAKLRESHAPDRFTKRVAALPNTRYENLRAVAEHLGMNVESQRF